MQKKRMLLLLNVNVVANIRSHINLYMLKSYKLTLCFTEAGIGRFKKGN